MEDINWQRFRLDPSTQYTWADIFCLKKGPDLKRHLSMFYRDAACPSELLQHFVSFFLNYRGSLDLYITHKARRFIIVEIQNRYSYWWQCKLLKSDSMVTGPSARVCNNQWSIYTNCTWGNIYIREARWHSSRIVALEHQRPRFNPDYRCSLYEVRYPCDHVGFRWVLRFPPTLQRHAGLKVNWHRWRL